MVMTAKCKRCGKKFHFIENPLCEDCLLLEQEEYELVYDYLIMHKGANTYDVSKSTGVSEKTIIKFINEGRLAVTQGNFSGSVCQICGMPSLGGRLCDDCAAKMRKNVDTLKNKN